MKKQSKKKQRRLQPSARRILVFGSILVMALLCVVVLYWRYGGKTEEQTSADVDLVTYETPWKVPEDGKLLKDYYYTKKDADDEEQYVDHAVYSGLNCEGFQIKHVRKFRDGKEEVNYFNVRRAAVSDTARVYEQVRKSGNEHFAPEDTFDTFGQSPSKTERTIINRNNDPTSESLLILHSKDNKAFIPVGFIGVSTIDAKEYLELKDTGNIFYARFAPEVTGNLRSLMPTILYGYVAKLFYYEPYHQLILNVHKDNRRSHSVAQKLACFTKLSDDEKGPYIIIERNRKQKKEEMEAYYVRQEAFEAYFLITDGSKEATASIDEEKKG